MKLARPHRLANRLARAGILASAVAASLLVTVQPVDGHVNRIVGKYLIFMVLIEEPTFQDNRAGFEFWVRDGDRPIDGLDRTLHAAVVGSGGSQQPSIEPMNARGFYDVEIDPGKGGFTRLRLTGNVEATPIDESFDVVFPAYPRVTTSAPTPLAPVSDPPPNGSIVLVVVGLGAVLAVVAVLRTMRGSAVFRPH